MKRPSDFNLSLLLALMALGLGGCLAKAPTPLAENPQATSLAPLLPTLPGGTPNPQYSYYATPNPAEKVMVTNIQEIAAPPNEQSYSIEAARSGVTQTTYIVDQQTQSRFRLGDDTGNAYLYTQDEKTLLWYFTCKPCPTFAAGLYFHSLENHQDGLISSQASSQLGAFQIAEPWVVYMMRQTRHNSAQLYAYNLQTQETRFVAENAFLHPSSAYSYFAINEEMITWAEVGEERPWPAAIHVYDLTTQVSRKLALEVGDIRNLAISRHLVVWWDVFWQGYDLDNEARFTIPLRPAGWENKPFNEKSIAAVGRQIQWTLESNGESHTFVGTVELKQP